MWTGPARSSCAFTTLSRPTSPSRSASTSRRCTACGQLLEHKDLARCSDELDRFVVGLAAHEGREERMAERVTGGP